MINLVNHLKGRPAWRRTASLALWLVGAVLAAAVLIPWLGNALLNGYGKGKVERAFAEAHPGCDLRIGALAYALHANRLVAQAVTVQGPKATLAAGRVTLTGVSWARLLLGRAAPATAFATGSLEATGLRMAFPQAHYELHTGRLRASVPDGELVAEGTELRPLLKDEALFAADPFRMTRFHVIVPEGRVLGLAFADGLQTGAFQAREIRVLRPSLDALVDRDKPVRPSGPRPLMVQEALAALRFPLHVDLLSITDGHLTYRERVVAGAAPGVLTFTALALRAENTTNHGGTSAALRLQAQARLMDAGVLKVFMTLPPTGPADTFHFSGTLGAMDLTRLNAFLERAEHIRIKSGRLTALAFEAGVTTGQANGHVHANYRALQLAILDPATGTEKGLRARVATFLMNTFKLRHNNGPDAPGAVKVGTVAYRRQPDDTFLQIAWFSLRSGLLDLIK